MKRYTAPLIWMCLIFIVSTDVGSMQNTSTFLGPLIQFFSPDISEGQLQTALFMIRKLAHFVEYAILAMLLLFAFLKKGKSEGAGKTGGWHPLVFAFLISAGYAGLDELHHAFVKSRTGSIVDVGIDSLGAGAGLALFRGGQFLSMSFFSTKKVKYFGWWFAWGSFSTVMALIVLRGGPFVLWQMIFLTLLVGVVTGLGAAAYYVRRG